MQLQHYINVDTGSIKANFSADRRHRLSLTIPFLGREDRETLCVIGQNPSKANEKFADKTVRYLEEYIWMRHEKYGALRIVNLYSCVDTNKVESEALLSQEADDELHRVVESCNDVLAIFGELGSSEPYNFLRRAAELREFLQHKHKQVYKLAIGSAFAPHPGNRNIIYSNFKVDLDHYGFGDVSL